MTDSDLFKIDRDPDTAKFMEIVLWNLQRFFYCKTKENGANLINRFIEEENYYLTNDFHFQDGAFRVAARIHYKYVINGKLNDFYLWLRKNNINDEPREASDYFRRNYYN